jgi:hypothetical protein
MFGYTQGTVIKCIKSADGKRCIDIVARRDGRFQFHENAEITEDGMTFWTPAGESGMYESAEQAERSARAEIPWLRAQISN